MNILLDTHAFLWFVADDTRLSDTARSLIEAEELAALFEYCQFVGNGD